MTNRALSGSYKKGMAAREVHGRLHSIDGNPPPLCLETGKADFSMWLARPNQRPNEIEKTNQLKDSFSGSDHVSVRQRYDNTRHLSSRVSLEAHGAAHRSGHELVRGRFGNKLDTLATRV